jgi:hypothetical protein
MPTIGPLSWPPGTVVQMEPKKGGIAEGEDAAVGTDLPVPRR